MLSVFQNKNAKINEGKFIILQRRKPSVLLELGDLANSENSNYLNSEVEQQKIAEHIFKSLKIIAENR
ncbi:N-acetylmuramoyl-L-alanine amidase [Zunongwangia atlantica 22II14-10F7]|uniref:N-acetylmuramoyl-L-alanine amidase n=1 Tax=Zunongwangia atlantica TaxID=1502297 RepID=UPI003605DDD4